MAKKKDKKKDKKKKRQEEVRQHKELLGETPAVIAGVFIEFQSIKSY